MNDYEVLLRLRTDRYELARKMRDAQFVADATQNEKAQPFWLRFHMHLHLPHFNGILRLRLRRQPPCTTPVPLSVR